MGHPRPRPKRLAAKLFLIRRRLGLSQPKLAKVLGVREYTDISKYERDINEAPLVVLLAYSRASGIPLERIVDDELPLAESQSD
jgi:transcriptional regulator with XRE-family HTH domain